jgi:hypothetical protein
MKIGFVHQQVSVCTTGQRRIDSILVAGIKESKDQSGKSDGFALCEVPYQSFNLLC